MARQASIAPSGRSHEPPASPDGMPMEAHTCQPLRVSVDGHVAKVVAIAGARTYRRFAEKPQPPGRDQFLNLGVRRWLRDRNSRVDRVHQRAELVIGGDFTKLECPH